MPRVLVLAIGNPLRSDDGVAWRAADELATNISSPELEICKVYQLTPELAENISSAALVIFVDAAASGDPGAVRCERVVTSPEQPASSHSFTPAALLQFAATLYDAHPNAYLISVAGKNFDHGESLSPEVKRAVPEMVARMRELIAMAEA